MSAGKTFKCVKCDQVKPEDVMNEGHVYPSWRQGLGGVGYATYKVSTTPVVMHVCDVCLRKNQKLMWSAFGGTFSLGIILLTIYFVSETYGG